MRNRENHYYTIHPIRSAAPARAREVIQNNTATVTDAVNSASAPEDARLRELRSSVKNGSYRVDSVAIGKKIVKDRLAGRQD